MERNANLIGQISDDLHNAMMNIYNELKIDDYNSFKESAGDLGGEFYEVKCDYDLLKKKMGNFERGVWKEQTEDAVREAHAIKERAMSLARYGTYLAAKAQKVELSKQLEGYPNHIEFDGMEEEAEIIEDEL